MTNDSPWVDEQQHYSMTTTNRASAQSVLAPTTDTKAAGQRVYRMRRVGQ
jgi:hypothetical protein